MSQWSSRTRLFAVGAVVIAVAAIVVVLVVGGASGPSYYLALGDSLSVGIQPTKTGAQLKSGHGYVNDVYAHYAASIPDLRLEQIGCPGDTSANVLTGRGNGAAAKVYHCDRSGGSQLRAALAFLHAHGSAVKLVSIDIGANDVDACLTGNVLQAGAAAVSSCVQKGEAALATNLPKILSALKAASAPGTGLVSGTLYDPYLAGALVNNSALQALAAQSLPLITKVNQEIARADADAGVQTADVAGRFATYDSADVSSPRFGRQPRNVVTICAYTWVCAQAPRGPNIHPNDAGYAAMARAYEQQLGAR